jgi:quercetin dioxygenase-like cupin family protein
MIYIDPQQPDADLPAPLMAALAEAMKPASASYAVTGRVHARLLDKVRGDPNAAAAQLIADAFITLRGSTAPGEGWVELLPKAHARLLFTDGEAESYVIRLEPGAWAPAHDHPADEECLVLEGSLWQGDVYLKAGDFHVARPGMKHGDLRTETGALVFIRYAKPLSQFIPM